MKEDVGSKMDVKSMRRITGITWGGGKERREFERNDHRASDEMGFLFLIAIFTRNVLRLEFKNSSSRISS